MPEPIEFYFDFVSPYGYFAGHMIEPVAARHGREVRWHPILLGPAFKVTGVVPQFNMPMRREYFIDDCARYARFLGLPLILPGGLPKPALAPCRAFYWLGDRDPDLAVRFAKAVHHDCFADGHHDFTIEDTVRLAVGLGIDGEELAEAVQRPEVKERLKHEVAQSVSRGVFGSPFFIVDGQSFWGSDRIDMLDAWLERGGW